MLNIPFKDRPTCTIPEAVAATGLGRTKLYEELTAGRIATIKIGARTLVSVPSLMERFSAPTADKVAA